MIRTILLIYDTKSCSVSGPRSRKKRVLTCHTRSSERFVENYLLLCAKKFSESYADCYDNMNGRVFEDWFESTLFPNLYKERKAVIMTDRGKYQNRFNIKAPTVNMKKDGVIITFMSKYNI